MGKDLAILTPKEAADKMRFSTKTVLRMIRTNKLPAFKMRGRWRIEESSVDAMIRQAAAQK